MLKNIQMLEKPTEAVVSRTAYSIRLAGGGGTVPFLSALGRQRQVDVCEFEANQVYTARSSPSGAHKLNWILSQVHCHSTEPTKPQAKIMLFV